MTKNYLIRLTAAEVQSKHSRVKWAESLILQLPKNHDGRNSWLMNYGIGEEAAKLREERGLAWMRSTESAVKL